VFGHGHRISGLQPRHADASLTAEIEIDLVKTGAELLDQAKPVRLSQQLLRHRRRHDEDDIGTAAASEFSSMKRAVQSEGMAASMVALICG
jgi:hypothetical protein